MQTATFSGLTCDACVKLLTKRLMKLSGVSSVSGSKSGVFVLESSSSFNIDQINQVVTGTEYTLETLE